MIVEVGKSVMVVMVVMVEISVVLAGAAQLVVGFLPVRVAVEELLR